MVRRVFIGAWMALAGCSGADAGFTASDEAAVRELEEAYRTSWLSNDSAAVMLTLGEDAVLLPDGSPPLEGKAAIRAYWWPADGSSTVIESYAITIEELEGSGDLAYVRGRGSLVFTYRSPSGESSRSTSESVHLAVMRRGTDGRWRIIQRAWESL